MQPRLAISIGCALALTLGCGEQNERVAGSSVPAAVQSRDSDGVVVLTDAGFIRGRRTDTYRTFRGIPYAAPPVGPRRWRSPQPAPAWRGVRDATVPASPCPQNDPADVTVPTSLEEDCLYLDVTAPVRTRGRLLPVMVWIHGGGFIAGSNLDNEALRLASEGEVVVVSINYRLGIFGFFGHPELAGSGSFGLEDQQAALRWVRRNARAFHGDPHNVTIFGVSAGGSSVCAHLTSPDAAGLFDRAIIQSEQCSTRIGSEHYIFLTDSAAYDTWKPRAWVEAVGEQVATKLGCSDPATALDCMRQVPVDQLLVATAPDDAWIFWTPAFDTPLLPKHPGEAIDAGEFNRVPVLAGTTRDEGTIFVSDFDWLTAELYTTEMARVVGNKAEQVLATYALDAYVSPRHAWSAIITDAGFTCPALEASGALARHVPTYAYEFADRDAPVYFEWMNEVPLGAFHGSDTAYLLDTPNADLTFTPEQRTLSDQMITYWTQFAATGDPNRAGLPPWPTFHAEGPDRPYVQSLHPGREGIAPVDLAAEHHCALWLADTHPR